MQVIENIQKMYLLKKNLGVGIVRARVDEVSDYRARDTAWCTLTDSKYPTQKVNVSNRPRPLTQADLGKTFDFNVEAKKAGQYTNLYASVIGESMPAQQSSPTSPYNPPDQSTEIRGKCMCQVICAGISSGQLKCVTIDDVVAWVSLMMDDSPTAPVADGDLVYEPVDSEPAPSEDDIPF